MSSQEQSSTALAYTQACPGHVLCTSPAQHTSAAPTPCECSLDCEMVIPSQLPLNIAFHRGPLRIGWLLWETLNRCRDNVHPWPTCAECSGHEQSSKGIVSVARLLCAVWFEDALDAGMQAGHTRTYAEHSGIF